MSAAAKPAAGKGAAPPKGAAWTDPEYFAKGGRGPERPPDWLKRFLPTPDGHRDYLTATGVVLVGLIVALGAAAYNTANNILFLSVSLLCACLILSGTLSLLNFRRTEWALLLEPHFRAGEPTPVRLEIRNRKRRLPTYGLFFNFRAELADAKHRVGLPERVDPAGVSTVEWMFTPRQRGVETVRLWTVDSKFPFGLIRRRVPGAAVREVEVWPERIAYEWAPKSGGLSRAQDVGPVRAGGGTELINVRPYVHGDPVRMVHWKASARLQKLMVREMTEENRQHYLLFLETPRARWADPAQFEVLCRFAASLAEDLFREQRLHAVALNDQPLLAIRKLGDLHAFLSALARLTPVDAPARVGDVGGATLVTFQPGPTPKVIAYAGGNPAGSA